MGAPVDPGQFIKGKYRVDRVLGEGGMGVVVAAHHLALDLRVAIKFLQPALRTDPTVVERFAREARAASKIESDHVARVTDVDALEDGTPFMVMEYLEGRDLSAVRANGAGLPIPAAVGYVLEACEAIGEAHRRGIVHRDIKPANLFLAKRSDGRTRIKVLDFGISKVSAGRGASPSVTVTSALMGSLAYMSPEQMLSPRDVDARTDLWALGVTLYELLTARVPFPGETLAQVCALVLSTQPRPPSALRPDVPPGLDQIVLHCLAKDRDQRLATVDELVLALTPYAAGYVPGEQQPAWLSATSAAPERTAPLPVVERTAPLPSNSAQETQHGEGMFPEPAAVDRDEPPSNSQETIPRIIPPGPGTQARPPGTVGGTTAAVPGIPKRSLLPVVVAAVALALSVVVIVVAVSKYRSGEATTASAPSDVPAPPATMLPAATATAATPSAVSVADPPDEQPPAPKPPPSANAAPGSTGYSHGNASSLERARPSREATPQPKPAPTTKPRKPTIE
jgi:eukaryotic-like serine/threonine-protein kinase